MQRLLTSAEVAELLAVPVATLYKWRYAGSGPPAIRLGKYLRWDPSEVEKWLAERVDAA